jgi:hypothetical protein
MDYRDDVISQLVSRKSFAEVGGLWGEVNEKTTIAYAGGASDLCQIDIWNQDSEWWPRFRTRYKERGVPFVREVIGSIDNPSVTKTIGQYDIVHCSGVLYHCPNPILTLRNLRTITREKLVIAVAVMPSKIENEHGSVSISDEAAIYIPCIEERSRIIIDLYTHQKDGGNAYGVNYRMPNWFFTDGSPNYGPWWWLWTAEYFKRLITASGFVVTADYSQFEGTGHLFVCDKIEDEDSNYGVF